MMRTMGWRRRLLGALALLGTLLVGCTGTTQVQPGSADTLRTQVKAAFAPSATPAPAVPTPRPTVAAAVAATAVPTAAARTASPVAPKPTARASAATPVPSPAATPPVRAGSDASTGGSLYFQRDRALWRYDVATSRETRLLDDVADVAVAPDGRRLALIRGRGLDAELWLAAPDGRDARRLTNDKRADSGPVWSSRGVLAYTSSTRSDQDTTSPPGWAAWCGNAEIRAWEPDRGVYALGEGCEPAWAPEGLRLAYATRPDLTRQDGVDWPRDNAIRLVNSQGENGWNPVTLTRNLPENLDPRRPGLFVHQPAWTPDGKSILYERFIGYALLCDHSTLERTDSRQGGVELLAFFAATVRAATVSPDGRYAAVDTAVCNAPGFGGYNTLATTVFDLTRPSEISLFPIVGETPEEKVRAGATVVLNERRLHAPAWAPAGSLLASVTPPSWPGANERPDPEPSSPFNSTAPGVISVRDVAGGQPRRLVERVDFDSLLVWRPS